MILRTIDVLPEMEGQRIDQLLRRCLPELTSQELREVFAHRDVKLDGRRVPAQTRVQAGSRIQVYYPEPAHPTLEIVYSDPDVLLINKPAGISVEPDRAGIPSLTELAAAHVRLSNPTAPEPIPCHRLDNQTSGLILFARHEQAAGILLKAFAARTLDKRYTCLVRGQPKPASAVCQAWLIKDPEAGKVRVVDRELPGSRPIVTGYETLEAGPVSRLEVHLITGRTHQIRAHLAALGHPLLGDDVYGDRAFNRSMHVQGRLKLCATSLTLQTDGALPQLDGRTFTIPCPF